MKYLVLEPSVFIEIKNETVLLYNSNNGNKLLYKDPEILKLLENNKNYLNIFNISNVSIKKEKFQSFIENIEENYFGFISDNKNIAPIQFSPIFSLEDEFVYNNETDSVGNLISNLREISIYLNSNNKQTKRNSLINKQIPCNISSLSNETMDIDKLSTFLEPVITSRTLSRINLLGDDILNYQYLNNLLDLFLPIEDEVVICYYLRIQNIIEHKEKINLLSQFNNFKFIFCVNDDSYMKYIDNVLEYLPKNKIEFNCLVESVDDVNIYNYFENNNFKYNLVPFYNGENKMFFEDNVYIDINDLNTLSPNQNDVFKNIKMNTNNFGKLIIINNGDVFANLNHEKLGNIASNKVTEIISNEYKNGKSWFLSRNNAVPCKDCIYNILCPPITNYELVINQNNLCHIK